MPNYKITGEANYKGDWRPISTVVYNVANEKIARLRATESMHKIKKVERI